MDNQNEPERIGGWLILVGIGVVLSPIQLLISSVISFFPLFSDGSWGALTTITSAFYHPLWGPLILGELIFNFGKTLVLIYIVYLFFSRDHLFPKFYAAIIVATLLFIPLDAWMVKIILPYEPMFDPDTAQNFFITLIGGMIWIPYLLLSQRAKATFVKGKPGSEIQPQEGTIY
jgi:hypothetical protein